jgi:hypothetical protein
MIPIYKLDQRLMCRPPNQILRIARILLSDILLWSQGARARDESGRAVPPNHPNACCWSLTGAIAVASNPQGLVPPYFLRILDVLAFEMGLLRRVMNPVSAREQELDELLCPSITHESVDEMNDYCHHAHVLQLLDRAIAVLEMQPWSP